MATIDEFVLKIALNASDFTKGATEVTATLEKTKASVVASGEQIEDAGKKVVESAQQSTAAVAKSHEEIGKSTDAAARKAKEASETTAKGHKETAKTAKDGTEQLSKMAREALGLFGIFASAQGMKGFVNEITMADSAMGRLAANMGVAPEIASAWGLAAERFGGSAKATEASITGLYTKLWRMKEFGEEMPKEYWRLATQGGISLDRTKDAYTQALQLATAIRNIAATEGRTSAYMWGSSVGFDEGTVNLIIGAGDRLNSVLREAKDIAADTRDVKAAQERQTAWERLSQTITDVGRKLTTLASGPLVDVANGFNKLLSQYDEWLKKDQGQHGTGLAYGFFKWLYGKEAGGGDVATISPEAKWRHLQRVFSGGNITRTSSEPLLGSVADAIQKQEGFYPGSRSYRNNNPGNIKLGSFAKQYGATEADDQGHAIFPDYALGRAALEALLRKHSGESLSKMGGWYAEDPNWARGVAAAGGLNINAPMNFGAAANPQYQAWNGAGFSAMNSASSNVSNSSAETHFNGDIHISLPSVTDANAFPGAFSAALKNAGYAAAFNAGPQ
jgi:hypothetical protein